MPDALDTKEKAMPHAAKKQPSVKKDAARARPVLGKIDYAKLSREHIRRYPKIRARLAE